MGRLLKKKGRCSIFCCGTFHVKQEIGKRVREVEDYYICDKIGGGNITIVILREWEDITKVIREKWVSENG